MKAPLSRTTIAQAGVAIADTEGLKSLTMRRVAAALGVATMSPYRHVSDREDLLVAMVDVIIRDRRTSTGDELSWDEAVRNVALADWEAFTKHPWLVEVWSTPRRRVDIGSFDQLERLLRHLEKTGISEAQSTTVVLGALGLTLGMAAMALEQPGATPELEQWWPRSITHLGTQFAESHPRSTSDWRSVDIQSCSVRKR